MSVNQYQNVSIVQLMSQSSAFTSSASVGAA